MEERVRKTSSDLRNEIVDLGGAVNITELHLKTKMKNQAAKSSDLTNIHVVRKFKHVSLNSFYGKPFINFCFKPLISVI